MIVVDPVVYFLSHFFSDNTEGIVYYSSNTTPNYLIDFEEEFDNGLSPPFSFALLIFFFNSHIFLF